jgi:hypothetical protein
MHAKPGWPKASAASDRPVGPTLAGLGLKLALVTALAATLALGSERQLPTFYLLLEGLCTASAGISVALALSRRGKNQPVVYGYWHEAMALGGAALLSHLALTLFQ